jgi:anti-sigma-K factor RskA
MNAAEKNEASEIELLLPWHAAGTLSARDAQRVETALADDPELALRYEAVRDELGQTIELNESLGAPSARVMAELLAKIDAEPVRRPPLSVTLTARVREFFASRSPRTLAWSAGAAALAIMLQAGVIGGFLLKDHGGRTETFETASALMSAPGNGSYAMVRFQPKASMADITQFLEANKLMIVGGPAAGGLYRVMIDTSKLQRDALVDRIKKLQRQDKIVGFIAAQTE